MEKAVLSDSDGQVASYYKPKRSKGERERRTWVARAQRELAALPVSDRIQGATPHFYLYAAYKMSYIQIYSELHMLLLKQTYINSVYISLKLIILTCRGIGERCDQLWGQH